MYYLDKRSLRSIEREIGISHITLSNLLRKRGYKILTIGNNKR